MSFEQLAAISAKVAERTREDGSTIGNALKTIITRTSKVGKMPQYSDEVDNETLSKASESLSAVGIKVYEANGEMRSMIDILSDLREKWDGLSDAQKSNIAFNIAATRQTSKFKNILEAWNDAMSLAEEATTAQGNALANQKKYEESFAGKMQQIRTQMDAFWVNFFNSDAVDNILDFVINLTEGFNNLADSISPVGALLTTIFGGMVVKSISSGLIQGIIGAFGASGLKKTIIKAFASFKFASLLKQGMDDGTIEQTMKNRFSSLGLENYTKATLQAELAGKSLLKTLGLTALGIAAVTAVVVGAVAAYKHWGSSTDQIISRTKKILDSQKEEAKQRQEAIDENNQNAQTLENLLTKYEQAKIGSEEYYSVRAQIAEQFPQLITGYDSEGRVIIANTELIRQQIQAYKDLSIAEQNRLKIKAGENIDTLLNGTGTGSFFDNGGDGVKDLIASRNKHRDSLDAYHKQTEEWETEFIKRREVLNEANLGNDQAARDAAKVALQQWISAKPETSENVAFEEEEIRKANEELTNYRLQFKNQYALIAGDLSDFSKQQIGAVENLEQLMSRYFESSKDFSAMFDQIRGMSSEQAQMFSDTISALLSPDLSQITVQDYASEMQKRLEDVFQLLGNRISSEEQAELAYQFDFEGVQKDFNRQISNIVNNTDYQSIARKIGINLSQALKTMSVTDLTFFNPEQFLTDSFMQKLITEQSQKIDRIQGLTSLGLKGTNWNTTLKDDLGVNENTFKQLAQYVIDSGLRTNIEGVIDLFAEWGVIIDNTADGLEKTFEAFQSETSESMSSLTKTVGIYNTAISEMNKEGSITNETYSELISRNEEYKDAIIETSEGIILNTKKARNLNKQEKKDISNKIAKERKKLTDEYNSNAKTINDYWKELADSQDQERKSQLPELINDLYQSNDALQRNISSLRDMQNQLNTTGNAWNEWQNAINNPNASDQYFSLDNYFDNWNELRKKGLTGTDDYQSFVKLLTGLEDEEAITSKDTAKFMEYLNERYFTEDRKGLENLLDDIKQVYKENGLESLIKEDGSIDITNDEMVAQLLTQKFQDKYGENAGFTLEALQLLFKAASDFNMGDPLSDGTYSDNVQELEENITQLTEIRDKYAEGTKEWEIWNDILERTNQELEEMKILQNTVMDQNALDELLGQANQVGYRDPETGKQKRLFAKLVYEDVDEATDALETFAIARQQLLYKQQNHPELFTEEDQASLDAMTSIMSYILGQKQEFEKPWIMKVDTSQIQDNGLANFVSKIQEYQKLHNELEISVNETGAGSEQSQEISQKIVELRGVLQELDKESGGAFSEALGNIDLYSDDLLGQIANITKIFNGEEGNELTFIINQEPFEAIDTWLKETKELKIKLVDENGNDITSDIEALGFSGAGVAAEDLNTGNRGNVNSSSGKTRTPHTAKDRHRQEVVEYHTENSTSKYTNDSTVETPEEYPNDFIAQVYPKESIWKKYTQKVTEHKKEVDNLKEKLKETIEVQTEAIELQKEYEEATAPHNEPPNDTNRGGGAGYDTPNINEPTSTSEPESIGDGHGAKVEVGVEAKADSGEKVVEQVTEEVKNKGPVEVEVATGEVDTSSLSKAEQDFQSSAQALYKAFGETGQQEVQTLIDSWTLENGPISSALQEALNSLLPEGESFDFHITVLPQDNAAEEIENNIGPLEKEVQLDVVNNTVDTTVTTDTSDAESGFKNAEDAAKDFESAVGDASKKQLGDVGTPITRQQLRDTINELTNVGNTTDETSTHNIGDLGAISATSYMRGLNSEIKNVGTNFDSLNRTATLTLNIETNGSVPTGGTISGTGGTGGYKGTASFTHGTWSFGKAFAKGNIGAPRTEEALVGELGPEMRVRGSRWELLGENGPEFRDIRKDDIIFNADQTADLLYKGKTNTRGKAFVHGTNGTAYAGRFSKANDAGGSSTKSSSGSGKGNGNGNGNNNNNNNNNTDKETKSLLDKLKEGWGKVIDWVALKLESYSKQLDKFITQAERTWQKINYRDQAYDRAIRKTDASIDLTKRAKDRYDRRATGVLAQGKKAIGTKGADARKAQKEIDEAVAIIRDGGNIKHIKQYSDDAKTVIEEYQKWYDLAKDTQDKLDELEDQRHELEKSRVELLTNRFESKINHISAKAERVQSQISALESMDMMADPKQYERLNNFNQQQINLYTQQIEAFQKGQSKVAKYSEDWYEYQDSIDSARASIDDLTTSMIENAMSAAQLHTQLAQLKNEKLDKQNDILDAKIERDQIGITDKRGITAKGLNVRSYVYQKNANTGQKIDNLRRANSSNASNVTSATTNLTNAKQTEEYSSLMQQIISSANGTDSIPANLVNRIYNALQADPSNKTLQSFYRKVLDYNAAIKTYTEGQYDYEMAQIQAKADAQANAEIMKNNRQARRDARNEKAENLYNVAANLYENENGTNFGYGQSKRDAELRKINANNKADDRYVKEMLSDLNSTTNKNSSSITEELRKNGSVNKKGYKQALKNAQSAMSSKKLISDGDINVIQKYNGDLAAQLLMYNIQVGDVEEARLEQATNYAANNARKDELINEKYEKRKSIADNRMERNNAYMENGTSDNEKNRYLTKNNHQIDNQLKENYDRTREFEGIRDTAARQIKNRVKKEDLEGMPKHYQQAIDHALKDVKNGYSIGDDFLDDIAEGYQKGYISYSLYQAFIDYKEANEWYRQSKYAQELEGQTLKKQKEENVVSMLQNVASEGDNRRGARVRGRAGEHIGNIVNYDRNGTNVTAANRAFAQTMGHYTSVSDIENDIMNATEDYADYYDQYQKQKEIFTREYNNDNISEGSDRWYEMLDIIEAARQGMDNCIQSVEELKVEMRNLEWQKFDDMMESVKRLNSEFEYFQGLIANETFFDEDNKGHITRYGMASSLLHKEAYQTDLSEALRYRDELDKINAQIALGVKNGGLDGSSKEVIDRQRQLTDAIRESVNAVEAEKQALIDLVRQGYEAQLSALNKSISKYKDLKNAEKEAYDYQKDIADQTKNITNLQKQLAAFEGNTSEESVATVQKLQAELEQAESDLQDKQYEKYLSDAQDMLDDLSNNFQEWIEYYMKDRDQVFDDMLNELRGISSHLGDNLGTLYRNSKDTVDLLKNVESDYFADSGETLSTLSDSTKVALTDIKDDNTNLNEKVVDGIEEGFDKLVDKQSWREDVEKQNNKHGFASGSKRILSDQLAWTQENGTEAIYRKSDGAILTPLGAGDMVFTHAMTEKLWDLASMNIPDMIKHSFAQPVIQNQQDVVMSPNTNIQMNITLPNVKNYDEFKQAMLNDKQFQNGVQAMTLGAAMGQNSLSKLKYS